jgi:uncharacterized Fe-S cluster-containing radical SAM superfamily protein
MAFFPSILSKNRVKKQGISLFPVLRISQKGWDFLEFRESTSEFFGYQVKLFVMLPGVLTPYAL